MKKYLILSAVWLASLGFGYNTFAAYTNVILADNPIQYFTFDETPKTNGVTLADSSGNARNATTVAAAAGSHAGNLDLATGAGIYSGRAIVMNGTAANAEYADTIAFTPITAPQFTIEMWIKPDSLASAPGTFQALYARDTFSTSGDVHFNLASGNLLQLAIRNNISSGNSLNLTTAGATAGAWNYIAATYDTSASGGTLKYYLNGSLKATFTSQGVNAALVGGDAAIGRWIGGGTGDPRNFQGAIDEFAMYNTVLNATQVATHFALIPEPTSAALLGLGGLFLVRRCRKNTR